MDEAERRARLLELVESISDLDEDFVILVEGQRDVEALRAIGVRGRVASVNQGKTIVETMERLGEKASRIIILTDWDRSGGAIARSAKRVLEGTRVSVDLEVRREFARLAGADARTVEGLPSLCEKALADKSALDLLERRRMFASLRAVRSAKA